jgi:vacuolar-type H+-ATPase subunit H
MKDAVEAARTKMVEEEHRIIAEAEQKAELIIDEAWSTSRETLQEAARTVAEVGQKLDNHMKEVRDQARGELKHKDESKMQPVVAQEKLESVVLVPESKGAVAPESESVLYYGEVELQVETPTDVAQLGRFLEQLLMVPRLEIRRFERSVSEGIALIISTDIALPLFTIVKRFPPVKDVTSIGKDIRVSLHPIRKSKESKTPADSTNA